MARTVLRALGMGSHTVTAVLLDVDGTLVDSNDAHARAWVQAFAKHGVTTSLPFAANRRPLR